MTTETNAGMINSFEDFLKNEIQFYDEFSEDNTRRTVLKKLIEIKEKFDKNHSMIVIEEAKTFYRNSLGVVIKFELQSDNTIELFCYASSDDINEMATFMEK